MTLADILKPAATVTLHAQAKGTQLGAASGLAVALPALALAPTTFNAADAPPLVAAARISGTVALLGTTAATIACAAKLARLSRDEIEQRASNLERSQDHRLDIVTTMGGAAAGLALVGVRVSKLAEVERQPFGDVLCSWQSCWDAYCFAAMGAAVGFVTVKGAKLVACKIGSYRGSCKQDEQQQQRTETEGTGTGEMKQVEENVTEALDDMGEAAAAADEHDKSQ